MILKKAFLFLVISGSLTFAQLKSDNSLGANLGIFWITGESSESFDLGYTAGLTYEHRFTNNFTVEISPFAGYVYGEEEYYFYGWYADNYIYGISITPKATIPIGDNGLQLVFGPKLAYSFVSTDLEIWLPSFFSSYNDESTKTNYSNGVFSFGAIIGFEYSANDNFAFGLNFNFDNLDITDNFEDVDWANEYSDYVEIKNARMGINLNFKFGI